MQATKTIDRDLCYQNDFPRYKYSSHYGVEPSIVLGLVALHQRAAGFAFRDPDRHDRLGHAPAEHE